MHFVVCSMQRLTWMISSQPTTSGRFFWRPFAEFVEVLQTYGLYVNAKKRQLNCRQAKVVGHLCSKSGVAPDVKKVEALTKMEPPQNKQELHSFLGAVNVLQRYLRDHADRAAALTALMKKDVSWCWAPEQSAAYEAVKDEIGKAVVLSTMKSGRNFIPETDASDHEAMKQEQDGEEKKLGSIRASIELQPDSGIVSGGVACKMMWRSM
eukprot:GHVS01001929.1.p1 GENE.GHVS01001929.1~~GHVS01001929.1.p1  ORF type:complete len:209 (-),score=19.42 GHVS01001929.1:1109-1735(-)